MSTAMLTLDDLVINGQKAKADIFGATSAVTMTDTMTGASAVTVTTEDPDRVLLRSGLATTATTMVLDGAGWQLAHVGKQGNQLVLTFEDIAVAKMRRAESFFKVKAGQMSRAEFVRAMVRRDTPWIAVHEPVAGPAAKKALSRGKARGKNGSRAKKEDTWDAATRIMGEIQWRTWAKRGSLWVTPDSYLLSRPAYTLSEGLDAVDNIDLDHDIGKPAATATVTAWVSKRALAAGSCVLLNGMGAGDGGKWLVDWIERTAFSERVTINLIRPQPTLPEPQEASTSTTAGGEIGEDGFVHSSSGGPQASEADVRDLRSSLQTETSQLDLFVSYALDLKGSKYVWGASGPHQFDCSGFVQFCARVTGWKSVSKPVTALWANAQQHGRVLTIAEAGRTRGALLFRVGQGGTNHVAISLGDGKRTIEAMGAAYGVCVGTVAGRFNHAGLLGPMLRSGGHPG